MIITLGMNVIVDPYFVIFQKHDVKLLMHEDCKVVEGTNVITFCIIWKLVSQAMDANASCITMCSLSWGHIFKCAYTKGWWCDSKYMEDALIQTWGSQKNYLTKKIWLHSLTLGFYHIYFIIIIMVCCMLIIKMIFYLK